MLKYCIYFFIGLININYQFINCGIISRNEITNINQKISDELLLFEGKNKNISPEYLKNYIENEKIVSPYKIEKDIQLDFNFKPLNDNESTTSIPTIWSFMDENGSEERKKLIEQEIEDPFKNNKK
uniref:Uncharacterized protein n=1 Tax=Strongyloides stercoralis TaxID=6248 RepID=A0A0K0EG90_STRER